VGKKGGKSRSISEAPADSLNHLVLKDLACGQSEKRESEAKTRWAALSQTQGKIKEQARVGQPEPEFQPGEEKRALVQKNQLIARRKGGKPSVENKKGKRGAGKGVELLPRLTDCGRELCLANLKGKRKGGSTELVRGRRDCSGERGGSYTPGIVREGW